MDSIATVIDYLKNIQDNLIGILIPTIISAVISLITLIINSIIQYLITNHQYKSKQYEIMRAFYPEFKSKLIDIQYFYITIENNQLYTADFCIVDYIGTDWSAFRQNLDLQNVEFIDVFEDSIKSIIKIYIDLNQFFKDKNMPTSSKKVQCAINDFQNFCALFDNEKNGVQIYSYKNYKSKDIKELIKILDNHYNKF